MIEVKVTRDLDFPVDKAWSLVADFGNVGWMPAITKCETEGEGVGMVRNIFVGPDGPPVRERMIAIDNDARRLDYVIDENNPLPVGDYKAHIIIRDRDGGSTIEWRASFVANGADDATAKASVEGMYGVLIDWVVGGLEG